MKVPSVAVALGAPAGIGPEIIASTFTEKGFQDENRAFVVGDAQIMRRAVGLMELSLDVNEIENLEEALFEPGSVDVLQVGELPGDLPFGELDTRAGAEAFDYVRRATGLALEGGVGAVATAPLNKEAMHMGGYEYPGHTEILAELTGTRDFAMMLQTKELRVSSM
jgi:4-hydroxythreonine-4-phosphate dehydrogenase